MEWLARRSGLSSHDFLAVSLTFLGSTAAAFLSVLQFPQPTVWHAALGGIVVLTTTGTTALSLRAGNRAREARERGRRQRLFSGLVEDICRGAIRTMSARPDETSAVVFVVSSDGLLRTVYEYNKGGQPDHDLTFEKYVGAVGHAWATSKQVVARLDTVSPADLALTWKLSAEQIRLTEHLKTIVATPIFGPDDPETIVGVVSIDSSVPDSECFLSTEDSLNEALQLAATLARVLTLAELVQSPVDGTPNAVHR